MELLAEDVEEIRGIARRFAGRYPYPEFDDLVQEGTMRGREVLAKLDLAEGTRRAYLGTCVRNRFRDIVRKEIRRLRRTVALEERHGDIPCPRAVDAISTLVTYATQLDVVRASLDLPSAEASVVTLMLQGADDDVIAQATNRSLAAVYTARSNAVRRLRLILADRRAA